jgi:kynureninase
MTDTRRMTDTDARPEYRPEESFAQELDRDDELSRFRNEFHLPAAADGTPLIYFAGHSLGLQPKSARGLIERELDDWADLGVLGHEQAATPWYSYHENFRQSGARLVGAEPGEVVMMNSLTVNLHLMLVSFFRPTPDRHAILMEAPAFPSDTYAIQTQLRHHGIDPDEGLITIGPRDGEHTVRTDDIERVLEERGETIATVLLGGVNFLTGQLFDIPRITTAAREKGCFVGVDIAHAAGNVELRLHDWDVDFAVWCNYKYINSGPGSIGGCFVHRRHGADTELPRFGGWWGNDPDSRFEMHLIPRFEPVPNADAWQISNPSVFAMTPLLASIAMFDEVGMPALRRKSERLTGYLEYLIDLIPGGRYEIITPRDPKQRGCQLSLLVHAGARECEHALAEAGVICDFREPNVIRAAPTPLYNTFHEVWRFARILAGATS